MKKIVFLACMIGITSCATKQSPLEAMAPASVGIVNHTGNFIYSASVDGYGGGPMARWGAGHAGICCASIYAVWRPGINVSVEWDMPEGHQHIVKAKMVEIEKYDSPGDIYMHFFPDNVVRVVVSNWAGYGRGHPIQPPTAPSNEPTGTVLLK